MVVSSENPRGVKLSNVMEYSWDLFKGVELRPDRGLDAVITLILQHRGRAFDTSQRLFIAGCGDGREAFYFQRHLNCNVLGIDYGLRENVVSGGVTIQCGDLMSYPLEENSFACAFSYHVIEHVADPILLLRRLRYALQDGEILLIGFPNKSRVVGYLGSGQATVWQKVRWNLKDWMDRLTFRFENRLGAHAGFRGKEFAAMCDGLFSEVIPVTNEYMLLKYGRGSWVVRLLIWSGLASIAFPSCYFVLRK